MISFSEAQLLAWASPLLWPFLRALALFSAMPVLGQRPVPMRVRIGLAALVAWAAQASLPPLNPAFSSPEAMSGGTAVLLIAQQLLIGLTMGFAVRLVFAAVEFAGEIIGLQMGLNYASFFDPLTASQGTAVGRLLGTVVAWMFIVINGHLIVIGALVNSFTAFPIAPEPFAFLTQTQPQRWGAEIFSTGLWLALPLITLLLAVNLVLGVMSRVAPQFNLFALGFPVTLGVGLLGLILTLPSFQTPVVMVVERVLGRFQ